MLSVLPSCVRNHCLMSLRMWFQQWTILAFGKYDLIALFKADSRSVTITGQFFTFGRRRFTWATIVRIRVEVPEKLKWRPSRLSNCLLTRPSWRKKSLLSIKWIERLLFVIVWRHSLTYFALLFKFCRRDGDVLWLRVLFPLGKMLDISMTHLEKKCMLC